MFSFAAFFSPLSTFKVKVQHLIYAEAWTLTEPLQHRQSLPFLVIL